MKKTEFQQVIKALGWSQVDLAKRLSVHVNTVSAWSTGRIEVPGPVSAYLKMALGIAGLLV